MSVAERAWAPSSSRLHFSGAWHESDFSRSHDHHCSSLWALTQRLTSPKTRSEWSRLRLIRNSRYRKFRAGPRVGGRHVAGTVLADWTRRSNFTSGTGRIESGAGQDPRILDRAAFELGVVAPGEKGDRPPHGADLHTRACPLRRNATTDRSARKQRA